MELRIDAARAPSWRAELRLTGVEAYLGDTWLHSPSCSRVSRVSSTSQRWDGWLVRSAAPLNAPTPYTMAHLTLVETPRLAWP